MNPWGLKGRALFLALSPALLIATVLTALDIDSRLREIDRTLRERGFAIVRQLSQASEFGVFSGNREALARLAFSAMQEADVTAVTIIGADGQILAARGEAVPILRRSLALPPEPAVSEHGTLLSFSAPILQSQTEVEHYLDASQVESSRPGRALGRVIVEVSRLPGIARGERLILSSVLVTLAVLAVAALLSLRLARQVTEPILALSRDVARIARGDLGVRVETGAKGELALLERGINNMARALQAVQDAQEERRAILATVLDSLDAQVYVADLKTYELLFVNRVTREVFGNVVGQPCWRALHPGQDGPCRNCINHRLLRHDGQPGAPCVREIQDPASHRWFMLQDSALKWVDERIVRMGIVTDITESKRAGDHIRRLERQIMEIGEQERMRFGHELHDGLGQQLTGIALLSKVLAQKLARHSPAEAEEAERIVAMVNQAVAETRQLARGLQPVEVEENGLMSALDTLAGNIEKHLNIHCEFRCKEPVPVANNQVATQLFRIAQEAVNNAIKHGGATQITIALGASRDAVQLAIHDNGAGFSPGVRDMHSGMGLQIMQYRARMAGATLEIDSAPQEGTCVRVSHHQSTVLRYPS